MQFDTFFFEMEKSHGPTDPSWIDLRAQFLFVSDQTSEISNPVGRKSFSRLQL